MERSEIHNFCVEKILPLHFRSILFCFQTVPHYLQFSHWYLLMLYLHMFKLLNVIKSYFCGSENRCIYFSAKMRRVSNQGSAWFSDVFNIVQMNSCFFQQLFQSHMRDVVLCQTLPVVGIASVWVPDRCFLNVFIWHSTGTCKWSPKCAWKFLFVVQCTLPQEGEKKSLRHFDLRNSLLPIRCFASRFQ